MFFMMPSHGVCVVAMLKLYDTREQASNNGNCICRTALGTIVLNMVRFSKFAFHS